MAQLIMVHQGRVLKKYMIPADGEVTIGRHPSNKIVIDNMAVSSRHAKLRMDKEGLQLVDLGSTNGTLVNNEKVGKCRLVHQDWVSIGSHILIVDMYESLSLEATMEMLMAGTFGGKAADQTVMFDMSAGQAPARLIFLDGERKEFELINTTVRIGKGACDIPIKGLWSFLAGHPAATIERRGASYFLVFQGGKMKPKVNSRPVAKEVRLNHQDVIKIGPLNMQIELN